MRNALFAVLLAIGVINLALTNAYSQDGGGDYTVAAIIMHDCPHTEGPHTNTVVGTGTRCSASSSSTMTQANKDQTRANATADAKKSTTGNHGCSTKGCEEGKTCKKFSEFTKTGSDPASGEYAESDCRFTVGAYGEGPCRSHKRLQTAVCTAKFTWSVECRCVGGDGEGGGDRDGD